MDDYNKIFGEHSEIVHYKKNETLLHEGKTEDYIYYNIKGTVLFIINIDGKEVCKSFNLQNSYFSSYVSFLTRKPSKYNIIAITDCIVERIHYNYIQAAYNISSAHQKNGRLIAETLYIEESERSLSFLTQNAEERYLNFIKSNPDLASVIPLKHIASYIGITPVSLSRIRNSIAKKDFLSNEKNS